MLVAKVLEVDLSIPSSVKEKFVKKRWSYRKSLVVQHRRKKFRSMCLPHLLYKPFLLLEFPSISSTICLSSSELLSGLRLAAWLRILDFLLLSKYEFKGEFIWVAPTVITFIFSPILFFVHLLIFYISLSSSLLS